MRPAPPPTVSRRPTGPKPLSRFAAVVATLAVLAALTVLALGPLGSVGVAPVTPPRPVTSAAGGAGVTNGTPVVLGPAFWGANLRPYYSLGTNQTSAFGAASLSYVRWPGGAVADRLNVTANRIYNDSGSSYTPPTSAAAFVRWCVSVGCQAIVGLPGEIDSPSTAAYDVAYFEHTLNFTPAYFEIGNEPAVWTHYGRSWSSWNSTQSLNATPTSYASLVHAYIAKVRAVDPTARFIGLPGLGTGAWGETTWIRAVVQANGANLSAVAIHVYPAGAATGTNGTLQAFYATLGSSSSLAQRVPADRAAIATACPTCAISLFASELGSGTAGGPYDAWMNGFAVVPYLSSEFVSAVALNLSNVDVFALQSAYGGSLLAPDGSSTVVATLYDEMLTKLDPVVVPTPLATARNGVSAVVTRALDGTRYAVLAANANLTATVTVSLRGLNVTPQAGATWSWSNASASPVLHAWVSTTVPSLTLAPESVELMVVNLSSALGEKTLSRLAGGLPPGLTFPSLSPATILGAVAPTSMTFPCWAVAERRARGGFGGLLGRV